LDVFLFEKSPFLCQKGGERKKRRGGGVRGGKLDGAESKMAGRGKKIGLVGDPGGDMRVGGLREDSGKSIEKVAKVPTKDVQRLPGSGNLSSHRRASKKSEGARQK